MKFENHSREIERQIIVLLVEDLLAAGYSVGVNDGEETMLKPTRNEESVYAAMSTTDEDYLLVRTDGQEGPEVEHNAWIRLIYGNDADVLSDYSTNLDGPVLKRAEELAERFR